MKLVASLLSVVVSLAALLIVANSPELKHTDNHTTYAKDLLLY